MDGGVQHATDVGAGDSAGMHAHPDQATRELVHDDEHPIALQHDRLAAEEVHAPEAVRGMADERQPRGASAARRRTIVFRQHAVHDVLVDLDTECLRDDAGDPWTPESGIARLQLDDRPDECLVRSFGPGLWGHGLEENSRRYLRCTSA